MKFVFNSSMDVYTNISNVAQIYIGEGHKDIQKVYAIIAHLNMSHKAVCPLVYYTDGGEARQNLKLVMDFIRGKTENMVLEDEDTLILEDNVKESNLITPEIFKDKYTPKGN